MNLTELYNAYKNEHSEPRKSTLKATYIFNGGKKLKIETNLELGIYKVLCGNKLVDREIARYEHCQRHCGRLLKSASSSSFVNTPLYQKGRRFMRL